MFGGLPELTIIVGFLIHFAGMIWWASTISNNQRSMQIALTKVIEQLDAHDKSDQKFHIETAAALGRLQGEHRVQDN